MLIALAFQERDVDAFLASVTHEQYEEWAALFYLHPQGWNAMNMVATRLTWAIAQSQTKTPLDEGDYTIRVAIPKGDRPIGEAILAEAQRIHHEQLTALRELHGS